MKVTVKLEKLVQSITAMKDLMSKEFDSSTAFDIMAIGQVIQPILDNYQKIKTDMLKKYGKEDEKTKLMIIKDENQYAFQEEWDELMNKDIEIDIEKISKNQLGKITLKPGVLLDLAWMFCTINNTIPLEEKNVAVSENINKPQE